MRFIRAVLKLTRLYNLIIIALCQLLLSANIENISYVTLLTSWQFILVVTSTLMIAAGGNVINDYYDVKIDYINKPEEVVVGKSISRRTTILLHALLSYGGILIALFISWKLALADVLIVILLWYYSKRLKCTPLYGNLVVGVLTAMVVMVLPMYFDNLKGTYWAYAYFAFLITVIRELTKDLEDIRGDLKFDCSTFPKKQGLRKSIKLLVLLEIIFLVSVIISIYFVELRLKIYSLVLLILPTLFLIYKSIKSKHEKDFSILSFLDKIIILFGLFASIFL